MVEIPKGVTVTVEGQKISVKGPKGEVSREFAVRGVRLEKKDGSIEVDASTTKDPKTLARTIERHIENMFKGVTEGYSKKMTFIYAHFPITVEIKGDKVMIKNFLGEKLPRESQIVGKTKVEVAKTELVIRGPDKEAVGQTAANIKRATKIRYRDSRVFQDGLYFITD